MTKQFRENWWSHYCKVLKKIKWTHKQYKSCDKCGMRAKNPVIKGAKPL